MRLKLLKILYITSLMFVIFGIKPILAATEGCPENVVVDILDQDCTKEPATFGSIANSIIRIMPFAISIIGVGSMSIAGFKALASDDEEEKTKAFKSVIKFAVVTGMFYSTWIILYVVGQVFNINLVNFG